MASCELVSFAACETGFEVLIILSRCFRMNVSEIRAVSDLAPVKSTTFWSIPFLNPHHLSHRTLLCMMHSL